MKDKKRRIIFLGFICSFWLGVIFLFSAMNANSSSNLTDKALYFIHWIRENNSGVDALFTRLTENHSIFYVIRKLAHIFVFCMLEILGFLLMRALGHSFIKSAIYSMLLVIGYACTDEFHQLFVNGRSGQISDVIIDTTGGCLGLSLVFTVNIIKKIVYDIYLSLSLRLKTNNQ